MGKAASQRRMKRMKFLVRLAGKDPAGFDVEWERRLSSWLELIRREAGRWRSKPGTPAPSVFDIVDEALNVLEKCGEAAYARHAREAHDLLTLECCRQFGFHSGLQHMRSNPAFAAWCTSQPASQG
jgi:aspartate aminotransferase-like enzyme